jgi:hypothetical protein
MQGARELQMRRQYQPMDSYCASVNAEALPSLQTLALEALRNTSNAHSPQAAAVVRQMMQAEAVTLQGLNAQLRAEQEGQTGLFPAYTSTQLSAQQSLDSLRDMAEWLARQPKRGSTEQ